MSPEAVPLSAENLLLTRPAGLRDEGATAAPNPRHLLASPSTVAPRSPLEWLQSHPRAALGMMLAWLALWRLPFFKASLDFNDSAQHVFRVGQGLLGGLQHPLAHQPMQSSTMGLAGLIFDVTGGALRPETCIALVALVFGAWAFVMAALWWRRTCSPTVMALSVVVWPMLVGTSLMDLSTTCVSTVCAFLWTGALALDVGLERRLHGRDGGTALCALASLCFGLATYTHLLAALSASVPASVVLRHALADLPPSQRRLRWPNLLLWGALAPALAVVTSVLVQGWQWALVGHASGVWEGTLSLLLRDRSAMGSLVTVDQLVSLKKQSFVTLGGNLGFAALCVGLVREFVVGKMTQRLVALAHLGSFVLIAMQWHWGFVGRIQMPMLLVSLPLALQAFTLGLHKRWWLNLGSLGFLAAFLIQSLANFDHVIVTRRFGEHPPTEVRRWTEEVDAQNGRVILGSERAFAHMRLGAVTTFGSEDEGVAASWGPSAGSQPLFASVEGLRYSRRMRDGQLVLMEAVTAPRDPMGGQRWVVQAGLELLPVRWLGRGEVGARLLPAGTATPAERVASLRVFLDHGWSAWLVHAPEGKSAFARIYGTGLDCIYQERVDACDVGEILSSVPPFGRCDALDFGLTDAAGWLMQAIPHGSAHRVEVESWDAATQQTRDWTSFSLQGEEQTLALDALPQQWAALGDAWVALAEPAEGGRITWRAWKLP